MEKTSVFQYGLDHLTPETAMDIADGRCRGQLDSSARRRIENSRERVAELAAGEAAVYGINTGFGPLCTSRISAQDTRSLQRNLQHCRPRHKLRRRLRHRPKQQHG